MNVHSRCRERIDATEWFDGARLTPVLDNSPHRCTLRNPQNKSMIPAFAIPKKTTSSFSFGKLDRLLLS